MKIVFVLALSLFFFIQTVSSFDSLNLEELENNDDFEVVSNKARRNPSVRSFIRFKKRFNYDLMFRDFMKANNYQAKPNYQYGEKPVLENYQ
uniref:Uncharacterized protein n=1 Tax=Rhabditophanes sp. KR3021 TaxID=114890 RepID=A0AC35U3K5_9BILA